LSDKKLQKFQDKYISECIPKTLDDQEWDETFDKIVKRFAALQYGFTNFSE
jgi:hypothetical protein